MEFANSVVTLIGNIFSCGLILAFLIGVIYGIRFMLQIKQQDKEEYERKKAKDELNARKQSSDTRKCWKTDVKQTGGGRYDLPLLFSWKGQR